MPKTIVITGATKGIGKAVAERFAAEGFQLALCARNENDLKKLKNGLLQTKAGEIFIAKCDVSNKKDLKKFADKVNDRFGAVEVLFNNAGIFTPGQVYNEADGVFEQLMQTNLYSAYYLSRWLLPNMIKKKRGHIFTSCSVASIGAYKNGGSYSISKFGLLGLTKALRQELIPYNIKVTALVAGATYTDSWAASGLPESRFIKVEDIAETMWSAYNLSPTAVIEELLIRPIKGDI